MPTFYEEWLAAGAACQSELDNTLLVARDQEIPWIETRQDAKVKLMISNELGFATMGSNVLKAEIPVGRHTGKHSHGEESIHILQGEGFSIVDGQRFDWHTSSTLQIPYRAVHQHFNTGNEPVVYLAGMIHTLERFVRLSRLEQFEDHGENDQEVLATFPQQETEYYRNGHRALIHLEEAPTDPAFEQWQIPATEKQHDLMYHLVVPANGFHAPSVAVTTLWEEPPFYHGGRHAHLEAVVYVLEGKGYTEMQGAKADWEGGDVLYVPPAMWEHEHYNPSTVPMRQLRIQFGLRFWFTDIWPQGYTSRRIYDDQGRPIQAGPMERERERTL